MASEEGGNLLEGLGPVIASSMERAPWGWALFGMCLIAFIKVWPVLALNAQNARAILRKEKRDERESCQQQIDALKDKLAELELKLVGAISGYRILEAEVVETNPDAKALVHARAAISAAFTIGSNEKTQEGSTDA